MQQNKNTKKVYFALLALTAAFLAALFWTGRESAALSQDEYAVAAERELPAERLMPDTRRININTATAEELEQLPGIGPVLARAIVDYRTEHGPFAAVDELTRVSGIGKAKLETIQNDVTVGGEEK